MRFLLDVQPGSVYRGFTQLEPDSAEAVEALAELLSRNLGLLKSEAEPDGRAFKIAPMSEAWARYTAEPQPIATTCSPSRLPLVSLGIAPFQPTALSALIKSATRTFRRAK